MGATARAAGGNDPVLRVDHDGVGVTIEVGLQLAVGRKRAVKASLRLVAGDHELRSAVVGESAGGDDPPTEVDGHASSGLVGPVLLEVRRQLSVARERAVEV